MFCHWRFHVYKISTPGLQEWGGMSQHGHQAREREREYRLVIPKESQLQHHQVKRSNFNESSNLMQNSEGCSTAGIHSQALTTYHTPLFRASQERWQGSARALKCHRIKTKQNAVAMYSASYKVTHLTPFVHVLSRLSDSVGQLQNEPKKSSSTRKSKGLASTAISVRPCSAGVATDCNNPTKAPTDTSHRSRRKGMYAPRVQKMLGVVCLGHSPLLHFGHRQIHIAVINQWMLWMLQFLI